MFYLLSVYGAATALLLAGPSRTRNQLSLLEKASLTLCCVHLVDSVQAFALPICACCHRANVHLDT